MDVVLNDSENIRDFASILGHSHDKKERKMRGQRHLPLASGEDSKKTKIHDHSVPFVREVIGTGTLMQSQETRMLGNYEGIDVIVAEVWFRASGHGIKQRDMECIENYNRKHGMISILLILI